MNKKNLHQNLIKVKNVNSTNEYLDKLSKNTSIVEGTIISANFQTSGKGQNKNKWESEENKNIILSCYLKPSFLNIKEAFYLNIITSLSVIDFLKEKIKNTYIKWPNDILVNNKKISGILIKNKIQKNKISSSIIGVGININQIKFKTTDKATSLSIILQKKLNKEKEIKKFVLCLERRYLELKNQEKNKLKEEYNQKLYMKEKICNFQFDKKNIKGKIKGINENGELLIQINNKVKNYDFSKLKQLY